MGSLTVGQADHLKGFNNRLSLGGNVTGVDIGQMRALSLVLSRVGRGVTVTAAALTRWADASALALIVGRLRRNDTPW